MRLRKLIVAAALAAIASSSLGSGSDPVPAAVPSPAPATASAPATAPASVSGQDLPARTDEAKAKLPEDTEDNEGARRQGARAPLESLVDRPGSDDGEPEREPTEHDRSAHSHGTATPAPTHVDPLPEGVSLDDPVDTEALYERAGLGSPERAIAAAEEPQRQESGAVVPPGEPITPGLTQHVPPSCTGTGSDGKRVQVMYVREAGQASRYDEVLPLLLNEIANVDDVFAMSAQKTDGGRRVRWVHDSSCVPVVLEVEVPAGSLGPDIDQTFTALENLGYNRPDRKYLAFTDASELCGVGTRWLDDSPTNNDNDGVAVTAHSRIDTVCWSGSTSTPAHELMHNLGGVQKSAPNSTINGHCTDESDLMCYDDQSGSMMRDVCAADQAPLLDCNNDDYFTTREVAGSYLATSWNTADSTFLDVVPALVQVTQSRTSAQTGDPVTFTVASETATSFAWSASNSACIEGATDQASLTLRCPSTATGTITATVTATNSAGNSITVSRTVTITKAPAPTVTVTPSSARAGTAFALNATPAGKAPFRYTWTATECVLSSAAVEDPTATCPQSLGGQTETFTVTVSQADGQSVTRSAAVALVGQLTLTVSGASSMDAGESTTLTATPNRTATVTWKFPEPSPGCRLSAVTGVSTTLTCEPSYAGGSVTVRATASSSDGETASADRIVTVAPVLAVNLASDRSSMTSGERASFTATVNRAATVAWSLDAGPSACYFEQPTSTATSVATSNSVWCAADYPGGQLTVRATATEADGDTASAARTLTVSPAARATSWTATTATTGYPTALRAILRDRVTGTVLANAPVSAQVRWYGTRVWRTVKFGLSTNQNGVVAYIYGTKRAGHFRFAYAGSDTLTASAASSVYVRVPTKLSNTVRTGRPNVLRGKLTAAAGAAISGAKVTLQRRYAGTNRWRNVTTVTTSRYGNVKVRQSPGRKTYYRWRYAGSTTNRAVTSRTVYVRR